MNEVKWKAAKVARGIAVLCDIHKNACLPGEPIIAVEYGVVNISGPGPKSALVSKWDVDRLHEWGWSWSASDRMWWRDV